MPKKVSSEACSAPCCGDCGGCDEFEVSLVEACEEIIANDMGGMNSKISGRYDLLPAYAIACIAGVMEEGAMKYAPDNWRKVSFEDHLNHAMRHIFCFLNQQGNRDKKEHITHALTRLAMAVEQWEEIC